MAEKLRNAVVWVMLSQVLLVGAIGTGLHGLFGCEHGPLDCCGSGRCTLSQSPDQAALGSDCHDCAFCRRHAGTRSDATIDDSASFTAPSDGVACCKGCTVCDLLAQYHTATPVVIDPPLVDRAAAKAALPLRNAVVSAATRFALSRGPPVS